MDLNGHNKAVKMIPLQQFYLGVFSILKILYSYMFYLFKVSNFNITVLIDFQKNEIVNNSTLIYFDISQFESSKIIRWQCFELDDIAFHLSLD